MKVASELIFTIRFGGPSAYPCVNSKYPSPIASVPHSTVIDIGELKA